MTALPLYRIMVRLPDRPGALGAAASRIGALRGDVVGFEILQREAGAVIDEFVVALPPEVPLELLARELADAGVAVLDLALVDDEPDDPVVVGVEAGGRLLRCADRAAVFSALVDEVAVCLRADWAVVLAPDGDGNQVPQAQWGPAPEMPGLRALVEGLPGPTKSAGRDPSVVGLALSAVPAVVLAGREVPFGRTEEQRLASLVGVSNLVLDRLV